MNEMKRSNLTLIAIVILLSFSYEDDSKTLAYMDGDYAITKVEVQEQNMKGMHIALTAGTRTFDWLPETREYAFTVVNAVPAKSVTLNGQNLSYDDLKTRGEASYYYDASRGCLVVVTGAIPIDKDVSVDIEWAFDPPSFPVAGLRGVLSRANLALNALNAVQGAPGFNDASKGSLERLASLAAVVEMNVAAQDFAMVSAELAAFQSYLANAIQEVNDNPQSDKNRQAYAVALLTQALISN